MTLLQRISGVFRSARISHAPKQRPDADVLARNRTIALRHRVAFLLALVAPPLPALEPVVEVEEKVARVPVAGMEMVITHYKPQGQGPFPLVIINHGRAGDALGRASVRRQRYPEPARYFVQRGFAVVVPTRIGYGATGGPDLEHHGVRATPAYREAVDGALESIVPALEWAQSLPHVDARRVLAVGTSMGGISSIALAARNPPALLAVINFAGGKGGDPAGRPARPCAPDALAASFAAFGKTAKAPSLWLYSENDRYWGRVFPMQWHRAYVAAGGRAEFRMLPPFGRDGHFLFTRAADLWGPHVDSFLREHGLLPPVSRS